MARPRSLVIVDDRNFDLSQLQLDPYQGDLFEYEQRNDGLTPWTKLPKIDQRNVLNRMDTCCATRYRDDDDVYVSFHNQMQPEMITTLVDTLPQILSLTVVHRIENTFSLDQIIRMINNWRDHLVRLKLYLTHEDFCRETGVGIRDNQRAQTRAQTVALFDSINRAPALKHLTLELDNFGFNDPPELTAPLTILSQLSTLHFDSRDFTQCLFRSLVVCASDNRSLRICTKDCNSEMEELLRINPQFCDRFNNAEFAIPSNGMYDSLNLFCTRFTSLVHLVISNFDFVMSITKIGQCLCQLSQLVHLEAILHADPLEENLPEPKRELALYQIVPVLSVLRLSFTLHVRSHRATERFLLHRVFPNVQTLNITNITRSCTDCRFKNLRFTEAPWIERTEEGMRVTPADMRRCAQNARLPFRCFTRLHTIEVDANDLSYLSSNVPRKLITKDEL